uniref:C2H2-type domain-containing protein n=1 Tax=Wuchereria bancrofti TaxID=6293 RepID=A0AAF5Q7S6_WUCBA
MASTSTNLLFLQTTHSASMEINYTCHYRGCAMITKSYNEYLTHRKTHGQPFIYECKVPGCGRTFHYESTFRSHKQTHEPHPQCEDCGKFFVSRDGLQKHKKHCQTKSQSETQFGYSSPT